MSAGHHPSHGDTRQCPRCAELRDHPLAIAMSCAVPLLVQEIKVLPERVRAQRLEAWRTEAVPAICEHGDDLQYGSTRKGETAQVFNAAAKGVAALSFHPGGVRAFGLHWCAEHCPGGTIPTTWGCPGCAGR